eukprot:CAMPEP_0116149838 /NCGR_PEP_ID=MMETSP0329-20121206/19195_1 /TAXON_ID=697910 /ORGANISM="Pseudo-nitzschia arenysensis, Strain B593" /LENGTH=1190 /DNA_ID=CAMNT_0003646247 /DNA_START=113 /DNA_END=3685 /DNA_ORIENTATION=+
MAISNTMRLMFFFLFASATHSFVVRRSVAGGSKTGLPFLRARNSYPMQAKCSSRHQSSLSSRRSNLLSFRKRIPRAASSVCERGQNTFQLSAEAETLTAEAENTTNLEAPVLTKGKTEIVTDASEFIKPDRDRSQYRWIKLENNLQVLLVSTATENADENSAAKVEAASVHVQAGHFDDTIPGLAHFHEHMLFLGTEKYPSEEEYEAFLSAHGGYCNAYTDMEDTNYYFSVTSQQDDIDETSEGLKGGLDRLAQFFIAPNFEESMVERELRAIDSEYRNGKTSDGWRNYQFLKSISNQNHPFSNFGCGNYETLSSLGTPVQELKDFWKKYYTTSNMRLAVVGCSSLDALQQTVEETFGDLAFSDQSPRREKVNPQSPVFSRENAIHDPENPAFGPDQLGKFREVIPLLESRTLKVQFVTPPVYDPELRKTRPHRVLSHLIGHEAPGSLHHLLNEKGYITGLSSGAALDVSDFSLFSVSLSLTPKGMKAKDEILDLVFQWLALIKNFATEQPELLSKYHKELNQIGMMNFKFREQGSPMDFCSSASELMFETKRPEEILVSGSKSDDYDPVIAAAFMERLTPYNCMINVVDSDLKQESADEWLVEPLYGANYRESTISEEQLKSWENPSEINPELLVPGLNEYIPTDFSLRSEDSEEPITESDRKISKSEPPKLFFESENFRMWHKIDQFWRVPKTYIRLSIVSPSTYASPRSMTLSRIFQKVLNDDLNSFVYDASLAGCNYRINCAPTGYKISVRGYSEKLPHLLETLTSRMLSLIQEMKEGKDKHPGLYDRFEKAKESLLRQTKNYRLDTPHDVANYNSRLLMEENVWYLDDYIDEMEGEHAEKDPLTMEECAIVAEESLTSRLKAEAMCIGNIDEKGTTEVIDVVNKVFIDKSRPLNFAETPKFKSVKLPTVAEAEHIFGPEISSELIPTKYQELAVSPSEENNAVEMTFQIGSDSIMGYEGIGILDLIGHLAYSSAYNQLRTKEQLGYIVSVYTRKTAGGTWGMTVVVQSSSQGPKYLEGRIEAWLKSFREELEEKSPEEFAKEARGVVVQLLEEDTKLSSEVGSWWNEIVVTETNHEKIRTPAFDRLEKLADELNPTADGLSDTTLVGSKRKSPEELKKRVIEVFDKHCASESPERRVMSSRVFSHASKEEYEETLTEPGVLTSFSDMRYLKEFLPTWPVVPYWRT